MIRDWADSQELAQCDRKSIQSITAWPRFDIHRAVTNKPNAPKNQRDGAPPPDEAAGAGLEPDEDVVIRDNANALEVTLPK